MFRLFFVLFLFLISNLVSSELTKEQCIAKGDNYIYVSPECIEYSAFEDDDNENLIIIVHGRWDEGTNTLGRYAPFAETMNLNTDFTTVAIALPGYSNSSTNKFTSLANKKGENLSEKKEFILFVGKVIEALKNKFQAKYITYIGHSAGAKIGACLTGLKPNLIQNIALAGGQYEVKEKTTNKDHIAFNNVIDNVNKNTRFLFIYGTKDKISKPQNTIKFYNIAKNKGLNVKLIKVEGAGHIDLDMTDKSIDNIVNMLENK